MDSSDEKVLLESLFSFRQSSGANQKKKEKDMGAGNIFKKNRARILPYYIAGDECQC